MKIQLYVTQGFSGAGSILRKKDGIYTRLDDSKQDPFKNGGNYWIDAPGYPCNQKIADEMVKEPLLTSRALASVLYRIPDDVEIYEY